ncbi:MAG: Hint domain-containing protein [Acidiphilium sp.]|nr:Hint domain-containing protein [Acidiphilium sp.]MDD4934940.1 Hint domain-containing protein [Acidiphilium sp.]
MSSTISTPLNHGVTLTVSSYADPITITAAGSIDAGTGNGILATQNWTVVNKGTVVAAVGDGVSLKAGGFIDNLGTVEGGAGAYGILSRYATLSASIENSGYISGGKAGVLMAGTGITLDNLAGGIITGGTTASEGVKFSASGPASGTMINAGLISSGDTAVTGGMGLYLINGAVATNATGGVISGGSIGIRINDYSQFVNLGTVTGDTGISVGANQNSVTIVDAGTITVTSKGADAISFASGVTGDSLTLLPGAVLGGLANGGNAADVVFAGSSLGIMANIGQEIMSFPTISITSGAAWDFTGTSTMAGQNVLDNNGMLLQTFGDALSIGSTVAGIGTIELAGGSVTFGNAVGSGQTIDFASAMSTLSFNESHSFSATIDGFQNGDTIDITGFGASESVSGAPSGDDFIVSANNKTITLTFGSSAASLIGESSHSVDGGVFEIVAPCFRAGTRLLTPEGPRPVESLRKGDLVVTHDGATRSIIWHGHRRIDCDRHPNPKMVLPVLIEEGAFGPGVPSRDLYVSPDHAVYCDHVLIPAKWLINGVSIRQVDVPDVTYHHIELESHNVVWAETLPTETYLECGNRHNFSRQKGPVALHANFAPAQWDASRAFAPLIHEGVILTAVRQRLHDRLRNQGARRVCGSFEVYADGRLLEAADAESGQKIFRLPLGARCVLLESSASCPTEIDPASSDRRRLGIAITDVTADGLLLDAADQRFGAGFHPPERRGRRWFRWTDGTAAIDVVGVREIAFTVQAVSAIWQLPADGKPRSMEPRQVLELR